MYLSKGEKDKKAMQRMRSDPDRANQGVDVSRKHASQIRGRG